MKPLDCIKYIVKKNALVQRVLYFIGYIKVAQKADWFANNEFQWSVIQKGFLCELLNYARNHTKYYKELITNNVDFSNCTDVLEKLPYLTKDTIREQRESIYSDEIEISNIRWANTGGSTGEPLRFPVLEKGYSKEHICQMLLYHEMGANPLKDLIISIDGTRITQTNIENNIFWKKSSSNFPWGMYSLSTIYMSDTTLPFYVDFLNKMKPQIMRGYPSGFTELANYCKQHSVIWRFQLRGVYLTSENYGYEEESLIKEVFNCPVWGQYGHTEASIFAVKKPGGTYYVTCPIYGFTEILNEEGKPVRKGQIGEIVVSGFNHLGVPFIRYKTGDMAEYGGTLENGSVVLNSLLGRSIDYLINTKDEKIFLVGFIFGGHLKAFNHIRRWQLEQFEKGSVVMKISQGAGFDEMIEKEIIALFDSKMLSVDIVYTDCFEKTQGGKFKFLIQHIK